MMGILFTSWFVAIAIMVSIAHSAPVNVNKGKFYVVSPSKDSEKFYLKLNRLGPKDDVSPQTEDSVCGDVLKSPFFSPESDIEDVYPITKDELNAEHVISQNTWDKLKKPSYSVVNVSVLQDVRQEAVFPCMARQKGKKELTLYLISREYDFNRWIKRKTRTKCPAVGGRFVFEYKDESKEMANLLAIVEEPACRLDYYPDGWTHYGSLQEDLFAIRERGQEICDFSTGRKVRACAIGLNARGYRDEVAFPPQEERIEPQCEERKLIFKYIRSSFSFNEWVIGCKADRLDTEGTTTYYMSLGYEPYQFLIYHPEKGSNVSELKHHFYSHIGKDNEDYFRDK